MVQFSWPTVCRPTVLAPGHAVAVFLDFGFGLTIVPTLEINIADDVGWLSAHIPFYLRSTHARVCDHKARFTTATSNDRAMRFSDPKIYENLYSPSKHGRQQTVSNTNEIKQLYMYFISHQVQQTIQYLQ